MSKHFPGRRQDVASASAPEARSAAAALDKMGSRVSPEEDPAGGRREQKNGITPASAALSSRLDKWTNYVQPHWGKPREAYRVVFRNYGQGNAEATLTIAKPSNRKKGSHRTPSDDEPSPEKRAENGKRAVARAKTTMRRTIMAASLDHLVTLTYRENMQDRVRGWSDFAKFARFVRKHVPGWPYVVAMELQERGAIHFHIATAGRQDVSLLRRLWHTVIGGPERGNIDVQYFRGSKARLAKYLAKYISKDLAEGSGNGVHRYKRSRGIKVPEEVLLLPHDTAIDSALIGLFEVHGATVRFHKSNLLQEGAKWLWACSW